MAVILSLYACNCAVISRGIDIITKTCPYNVDPLKPHFYIVKFGVYRVYIIFLISAQKHKLWVLVRAPSLRGLNEYLQSMF